jgi:Lon protease-like protein
MDEMIDAVELPLFPLNTVLFPGQVLPLHIFEERYRLMIRRCLAEDLPFGVVLIKRGREVAAGESDDAEPYSVGTVARIIESTHLTNGSMNIVTVGVERFRIRKLLHDQPYLRGEVVTLPMVDPADDAAIEAAAARVKAEVDRYVELISDAAGLQIQIDETPSAAQQIGYLAAITMQIDNREKQELLGSASVSQMLRRELALLSRENALLTWMSGAKEWPESAQFGFSGTLLPN